MALKLLALFLAIGPLASPEPDQFVEGRAAV
jgi:hypothetical protein